LIDGTVPSFLKELTDQFLDKNIISIVTISQTIIFHV
jgi:hypothetical protein